MKTAKTASMQTTGSAVHPEGVNAYSCIVDLLVRENRLTRKQVDYATRVRSKLVNPPSLLKVLEELGLIAEKEIKVVLRGTKNRIKIRIGDLLLELGFISEEDIKAAISIQKKHKPRKRIGEILVEHNFITEKKLLEILSVQLGFPFVEPHLVLLDEKLFLKSSPNCYRKLGFVPVRVEKGKVLVAFSDPIDHDAVQKAKQLFGNDIVPAVATKDSISEAVKSYRSINGSISSEAGNTAIKIVNSIIDAAVKEDASDVHIEPMDDRIRVRFRKNGIMVKYKDYPLEVAPVIGNRIKIMCKADIAEKRKHQGGRIIFEHGNKRIDLRVSIFITIHGEKIVLRLLKRQMSLLDIHEIGMYPRTLDRFVTEALDRPSGIILVTGPTGSGKTSTIYSCVNYLNKPDTSIITVEDPVEYVIKGVAQCSINPKIDLTFEESLRHIVRQDPDIVVIGEIRDNTSAEVAIQAALTGQKVLTTFHTEDTIGGLIRLVRMGIEPFLIASTVASIVAQRLLRMVCIKCARTYKPSLKEYQRIGYALKQIKSAGFRKGRGCIHCQYTGYDGRIAVFEVLILDEAIRNALLTTGSSYEIRSIGLSSAGLVTLLEDGLLKASTGVTTIEEVLRCLPLLEKARPIVELKRITGAK